MTHTRIRPFNTKDTYPEQQLDNDLAQTVVARDRTIFLRGQCPQELDGGANVGVGDAEAQAHKVMQNTASSSPKPVARWSILSSWWSTSPMSAIARRSIGSWATISGM